MTLLSNGIDGVTGSYLLPALDAAQLVRRAARRHCPAAALEMGKLARVDEKVFGPSYGVDPLRLESCGWGVIFASGAPDDVEMALAPLLAWRREQSGRYFRMFSGPHGYQPEMRTETFLVEHGSAPGQPSEPDCIPYYLLIVGEPGEIPFAFQFELGLQYAVGRIAFDTVEEYASYARTVVRAEQGQMRRTRVAAFFGPCSPDDGATLLSSEQLVAPLAQSVAGRRQDAGWAVDRCVGGDATRARLAHLVAAGPALLFSASHGVGFPSGSASQARHQGALLCSDWPGPVEHVGALPPAFYFSADDAAHGAGPSGLIAFMFACFGAGTPQWDSFPDAQDAAPQQLAPAPMIAPLAKAMLGHPGGGAQAVIGHVDRAWGWSFAWPGARKAQLGAFRDALLPLMDHHPVGHAMNVFRLKHGELAGLLAARLQEIRDGRQVAEPEQLAAMWTAYVDARNYMIIGDPAARPAL